MRRRLTFLPPGRQRSRETRSDAVVDGSWRRPAGISGSARGDERQRVLRHLARLLRRVRPPLTTNQQLRLLQLALRVKLKREGRPADAMRLVLPESDPPSNYGRTTSRGDRGESAQ